MPIIIKDYIWNQSESIITIHVPFKTINPLKADLFLSSNYVKASIRELFFEALLLNPIDVSRSKCIKTEDHIIFELQKSEEKLWDSLEPNISRKEKNVLKQRAIEEEHERFKKECEGKSQRKTELKKIAVREQIALETQERNKIEEIKKSEENNALGDLDHWRKDIELKPIQNCYADKNQFVKFTKKIEVNKNGKKKRSETPRLRSSQSLQVLFTPREFPTPSRESYFEQENEWLKKQAEARRSAGFVSEDIRPEEKNPQFLLAKGNEFMRTNNFLGAISAYSFGIKLSENFVDLYIARSEAHMCLENYNRAVSDCSKAIDLLKPAVAVNLQQRALCIGRRGVALCKLNLFKHGISELEASLKLLPSEYFEEKLEEANNASNEQLEESKNVNKEGVIKA